MIIEHEATIAARDGSAFYIESQPASETSCWIIPTRATRGDFYAEERVNYYELGDRVAARLYGYVDEKGEPR